MKGKDLLDKMELIAPEYIEAAECEPAKKKSNFSIFIGVAACLCLIFTCVLTVPNLGKSPKPTPLPAAASDTTSEAEASETAPDEVTVPDTTAAEPTQTEAPDTGIVDAPDEPYPYFNKTVSVMDMARTYIPGYFTERLDLDELDAIVPEDLLSPSSALLSDTAGTHGTAGFNGDGELVDVNVLIIMPESKKAVYLSIGSGRPYLEFDSEKISYLMNRVYFTLFEWEQSGGKYLLGAYGEVGGENIYLKILTNAENLEADKKELVIAVDAFAKCEGKPDLSAIKHNGIPEFFDREITLSEAEEDADFGKYVPSEAPDGFYVESVRRYKDQNNDHLSILYTHGLNQYDITIRKAEPVDLGRVTSVADKVNYDLSLYPIPRAESVPAELHDIVNDPVFRIDELTFEAVMARMYTVEDTGDSQGYRCFFSVLYGDIIVNVGGKGVDPQWIFDMLKGIAE